MVLTNISMVEFVILAVLATVQWYRHRVIGAGWAALAFALLAVVALTSKIVTDFDPRLLLNTWFIKGLVAGIFLMPYCLFRFAASFRKPRRSTSYTAVALTLGILVFTAFLRYFPGPGQPNPPEYLAFRLAFVVQWGFLFSFVVYRLMMAGAGSGTMAAKRMRLLAVAVAGLDLQVIVAAFGLSGLTYSLMSQAITVAMGALFLVALVVPSFLRVWWRKGEDLRFRRTVAELVSVGSAGEMASGLLPHVCELVGAAAAALIDDNGVIVAQFPAVDDAENGLDFSDGVSSERASLVSVRTPFGPAHQLVVRVSPYMPYFGNDELRKLDELADMVGLAMERFELAEEMVHLAHHDILTGLPNRALFMERLTEAVGYVGRRSDALAVMYIDLDRFKLVNDRIDHAAGDAVLVEVSQRLAGVMRATDTAARVGGDEFVAFAEVENENGGVEVAERIRQIICAPMCISDREMSVTASIGLVVTRKSSDEPINLLGDADRAMYLAKNTGRDHIQLFTGHIRDHAIERMNLERELDLAVLKGQLSLEYQPIFNLADGVAVGVEALVRWPHPQRGLLLGSTFVPVAEESGLIVSLGAWVLNEACRQAAAWLRTNPDLAPFALWVNKSAGEFHRTDLVRSVMDILALHGLAPSRLGIEVSESVFMTDTERLRTTTGELRARGVSIAIDNFGTGFSSLGYLERFPIDILKIDRSFVQGIGTEPGTTLVTACLAMAQSLGITTVAEGVESLEQGSWLNQAGCDLAQGFVYGRPMSANDAMRVLTSSQAHKAPREAPGELLPQ